MPLKLDVSARIDGEVTISRPVANASQDIRAPRRIRLTSGTGAGQADKAYVDRRTLAGGAHEDFDLTASLRDAFGRLIDFEQLRAIWLTAADDNAGDLLLGGGGFVGPLHGRLRAPPGGLLLLACRVEGAWEVVAPTDTLRVANPGGAAATYDLILIGGTVPDLDFSQDGNPLFALLLEHLQ